MEALAVDRITPQKERKDYAEFRMERVMGFEPTTSCLGSTEGKRREPLASFLKRIILYHHSSVN